ncbi:MAG: Fic family protein [Patescibacteria group bacterium]|jgi:Fic family protein
MFKPQYNLTDSIVKKLTEIAEAKAIIEGAKILPQQELKLRRQAIIRMSQSSTAIEGNMLNIAQVGALYANKKIDAPERDIYEVENYLKALKYIDEVVKKKLPISEKVILHIHKLVTDKTLAKEKSGFYRKTPVYVVKSMLGRVTEVVYTGPEASKVKKLCADLVQWIEQSEKESINPVIVAGIVHQEIAAIHPFADGNGRTARALATLILYQRGYDFRRLFALEDYYNRERQDYYNAINIGKKYEERKVDFTPWLEYFVLGFREEIENVKAKIKSLSRKAVGDHINEQVYLDPDQLKILDFIDQVSRITTKDVEDILKCPKRTAQLYLQKLKKMKMIRQVGKGPASAYILEEK